jgi:hypothetical protein
MKQAMIDALNSLEVIDWSSSCGKLEYVVAANTEENRKVLLDAGFTAEQIDEATDGGETDIDLTMLAMYYADAVWWSPKDGFRLEKGEETA